MNNWIGFDIMYHYMKHENNPSYIYLEKTKHLECIFWSKNLNAFLMIPWKYNQVC